MSPNPIPSGHFPIQQPLTDHYIHTVNNAHCRYTIKGSKTSNFRELFVVSGITTRNPITGAMSFVMIDQSDGPARSRHQMSSLVLLYTAHEKSPSVLLGTMNPNEMQLVDT